MLKKLIQTIKENLILQIILEKHILFFIGGSFEERSFGIGFLCITIVLHLRKYPDTKSFIFENNLF